MGKNRHSKDRLYICASEYARDWGGYRNHEAEKPLRALPFDCCALTLSPAVEPVSDSEGFVFERKAIEAHAAQGLPHPVTGAPILLETLVPIKFHRDARTNAAQCPITFKEFNMYSHIVANAKTGNVYSGEAIENLCRRVQSFRDLITDEPFDPKKDLITIQHPLRLAQRNVSTFHWHKAKKLAEEPHQQQRAESLQVGLSDSILTRLREEGGTWEKRHAELHPEAAIVPLECGKAASAVQSSEERHTVHTTGAAAASFTSTVAPVAYQQEFRLLSEREKRLKMYAELRKDKQCKAYVRLVTDLGPLNLQLHVNYAPETCHNFLLLCKRGYYDGTVFHRSVPNFMIQGGDPTGTGTGGESAWDSSFPDEFHPKLSHKGLGILSMANSGRNTNRSQFFLTYKSCQHLDNKHSIFGRLVGGEDTLLKMESLPVEEGGERPRKPPKILQTVVFVDPFEDFENRKEQRAAEELAKKKKAELDALPMKEILDPKALHPNRQSEEVGKYLATSTLDEHPRKKARSGGTREENESAAPADAH